ncbi:MAG TPA: glycosyltransferase [Candidatus Desulfovibrio intestinavium]|uniref:Glycosyltransferase n=1 Tax=Candidatus Desulfovibrio intestinavium TaxID=2838534 RepID=A0A9D2HM74_9BACT|nr:glycosyltransferase [Candidatus Desulfovibrio intestinavium]
MSLMPAVSVLLPVYNAASYVREAVASILAQTLRDFELILMDDGSTDASGGILRALAAEDRRIRLVQRENRGLIATLNEGLALARAPFVARMDADDIALPERLARQCAHMERHPGLAVLGSAIQYMDAAGRPGRIKKYPVGDAVDEAILWGSPLAHPAVMLRTQAVRAAGGYPAAFPHAEDYALWLRLFAPGSIDNLPDVLLRYRLHGGSVSHVHALAQRTSTLRAQALWLAGRTEMPAEANSGDNACFLQAIALPPAVRQGLIARMLALAPHLVGSGRDDPEGSGWLAELCRSPRTPELRRALSLYHLRAAKASSLPLRKSAAHLARSFFWSPATVWRKLKQH